MLCIVFFISFTELFSSRISVWFFFFISISVKFVIWITYFSPDFDELSVSCSSLSFLKTVFWVLYQLSCRSPRVWFWLLKDYCALFGDVIFPWFFHIRWEFCTALFTCEIAVASSNFINCLQGKSTFMSACYAFWSILWPCIDAAAPYFLLPFVMEFLSLHVFLDPTTNQASCRYTLFCFPNGGTTAQICGFFLVHRPWSAFCTCFLPTRACVGVAQGTRWLQRGRCVVLACHVLGVTVGQLGWSMGEVFPLA